MEIPGYRDFKEIGRGSASVVFQAYQEQFARTVAVKVMSVGMVEERLRRRFERECAATGRLTGHPNIATVLDSGFTGDGSPFITTAYYAHGSLGDRLKKQGPLPLDEVLRIGVKVAGALEAVHRSEILHRDIKPSNLLESGYGEPALTGFGISAIDPAQQAMTMAQSFAPVHTPPEVVLGKQATEATDTYQLSSTLYTLLAGHAPFETGTDDGIFQMLSRIQENEVPPIERSDVPMSVIEVLRVAMAKKPEDRYPTSAMFGERLQLLQHELGMPMTDLVSAVDAGGPQDDRPLAGQTIIMPNIGAAPSTPVPATPPATPATPAPQPVTAATPAPPPAWQQPAAPAAASGPPPMAPPPQSPVQQPMHEPASSPAHQPMHEPASPPAHQPMHEPASSPVPAQQPVAPQRPHQPPLQQPVPPPAPPPWQQPVPPPAPPSWQPPVPPPAPPTQQQMQQPVRQPQQQPPAATYGTPATISYEQAAAAPDEKGKSKVLLIVLVLVVLLVIVGGVLFVVVLR